MLWNLWTGEKDPYSHMASHAALTLHLAGGGRPAFPAPAGGGGGGGLTGVAALATRCWAERPQDRPSWIDIDEELARWGSGAASSSSGDGAGVRVSGFGGGGGGGGGGGDVGDGSAVVAADGGSSSAHPGSSSCASSGCIGAPGAVGAPVRVVGGRGGAGSG